MKIFVTVSFLFCVQQGFAQNRDKADKPDPSKKIAIVEAACGECQFGMTGSDCDLAVRMDGKAYFVDGTHIDSHGDAHATDGFCKKIRKAEVQGAVQNDRFKVSYFKLLPVTADSTRNRNR